MERAESSPIETGESLLKSGFVALVGRPNAGKSTLLNRLVGQKIAAVSSSPQTTRHTIRGIVTRPEGQAVLVDTPGLHKPVHRLNERMVKLSKSVLSDVDLVLLLADCTQSFGRGDQYAIEILRSADRPCLLLLNKIDRLRARSPLLPIMDRYARAGLFLELIPISARSGENVELVMTKIFQYLPPGPRYFAEHEVTDQSERTLAAEIVREKLLEEIRDELPYEIGVFTERFDETVEPFTINCVVVVERSSQKTIVIGRGGEILKRVGTRARLELENLIGKHLRLEIHVRVHKRWRDDEKALREMGLA